MPLTTWKYLPSKGVLQSEALMKHIQESMSNSRIYVKLLWRIMAKGEYRGSVYAVPVDEGQFLSMLVKIMNAKETLEIGVFTGYSLLVTALALPDDGQITAIDLDKEAYEVGLPFIRNAGVEHKINIIHSDGAAVLNQMLNKEKVEAEFDFAFVDSKKSDYMGYHEQLLKVVKVGGVIAYDNTLWFGFVARDEDAVPEKLKFYNKAIQEFNQFLASDPRVEVSQVSIGDGVTLCRRLD